MQLLSAAKFGVYLGARTCELFLCFVAIVPVSVYYVDFFVFFLCESVVQKRQDLFFK